MRAEDFLRRREKFPENVVGIVAVSLLFQFFVKPVNFFPIPRVRRIEELFQISRNNDAQLLRVTMRQFTPILVKRSKANCHFFLRSLFFPQATRGSMMKRWLILALGGFGAV